MRSACAAAVLACLSVLAPAPASAVGETTITVDASSTVGPSNQELTGLGWNTGTLDGVAALEPHQIRIDAALERLSRGPDDLDLAPLEAKVARVHDIGAEPLVILSYMPSWLGEPRAYGRDPTRVAPADLDAWENLIRTVVRSLATSADPAYRFEVWNEPDIPIFWQDTPAAFLEMALRTHRAVATVAVETGLELEIGGPATAFPDPAWIIPYISAVRTEGLPLDVVSWHYYANYPFLGPDGNEGNIPEPAMTAWGQRNPTTSPTEYRMQTDAVRSWVDGALAGSSYDPELQITEWNLSAGGLDDRHDTNEGAAFDAASLMEMERAGLDAADFYRAADAPGDPRGGDWGLVSEDGTRKPAWWAFHVWHESRGERLAVSGDDPATGLWARATSGPGRIDVLLASFTATGGAARSVAIELEGACASTAEIRILDADSGSLASGETRSPEDLRIVVPEQSVVWVRFAACE